ncbi:hypothetical protein [Streptomyces sp. NPDC003688]
MDSRGADSVRRWDRHGRVHVVGVRQDGLRRVISCGTCGWREGTRFLPWGRAGEHLERAAAHLAEAHQATVDPARR